MPQQDYDFVDFMSYDGEKDEQIKVCRVYLTKGELFYEGPAAEKIKKMVDKHAVLKPYRKIGGYTLLAALPQVFKGGHFFCTKIKEAFSGDDEQ